MKTTTWGAILDGSVDALRNGRLIAGMTDDDVIHHLLEEFAVYVIKDSTPTAVYVGQSRDVTTRLLSHVGKDLWGWTGPTAVGMYIRHYIPESLAWQCDLYTRRDCLDRYRDHYGIVERSYTSRDLLGVMEFDAKWLEGELIFQLSPHFNSQGAKQRMSAEPVPVWPDWRVSNGVLFDYSNVSTMDAR